MKRLLALAFLSLCALPSYALPGEAAAVIQHCGRPHAENFTTSNVTGRPQRDLIYNKLTLHFEPQEGGWSFTTAWEGHLPVTRPELEKSLPCFRSAIEQVAATPAPVVDPTIAAQTVIPSTMSPWTFGIPHLWLLVALVAVTLLLVLIPRRRRQVASVDAGPKRVYRKPLLTGRFRRRGPPSAPLS